MLKNRATVTFVKTCRLILFLALLLVLVLCKTGFTESAGSCGDTLSWTINHGTLIISGQGDMYDYTSNSSPWNNNIEITSCIIEEGVLSIGNNAFSSCKSINSVLLPSTLKTISERAFYGCESLEEIVVPNSVTNIGSAAFQGTKIKSITLPFVGASRNATGYKGTFGYIFGYGTVATATASIDDATYQCKIDGKYYYYYIPDTLTSVSVTDASVIPANAFHNCEFPISILSEIESVGENAFNGCKGLTSLSFLGNISEIPEGTFSRCSGLTAVVLPDSILKIGVNAFKNCDKMVSIHLPDTLTYIENDSFNGCSSLSGIVFPDTLKTISERAFYGCENLEEVVVPNSVINIDSAAFRGTKIKSITLPFVGASRNATGYKGTFGYIFGYGTVATATASIDDATYQCKIDGKYYYYYIPDTLTSVSVTDASVIPANAFHNCEFPISILSEIESVGENAFNGCKGLTSLSFLGNISEIPEGTFSRCSGLTAVVLPDSILKIGVNAFKNCDKMVSIHLPDTLTYIENDSFSGCSSLSSIVFPDTLKTISEQAFYACESLENIIVPNSVTNIGSAAFRGTKIKSITLPFVGASRNATGYKGTFGYIFGYGTVATATASIDDATYQCAINGKYYYYYIPSTLICVSITDATVIPENAFRNCSKISDIIINDKINKIESGAFYNSGIHSMYIPESITSIATKSFTNSTMLYVYHFTYAESWAVSNNQPYIVIDDKSLSELGVTITVPDSIILNLHDRILLNPIVTPMLGFIEICYHSSNENVVMIDQSGVLTAVNYGVATITVSADDIVASCVVSIAPFLESFTFPDDIWVVVTEAKQLNVYDIIPENAVSDFRWSIENDTLATVSENGYLTTNYIGTTPITVTDHFTGIAKQSILHICHPVTSISLNIEELDINVGKTFDIDANVTMRNQSCIDQLVLFSTSDGNIVQVDETTGIITAVSPGSALIHAVASNGVMATCKVTVIPSRIITIPCNVERIESEAFADLACIDAVIIPDTVIDIADDAFKNTDIVIIAPSGSYAEQWANTHGISVRIQ